MLYFENDYSEGAHEEVLKHLIETNMEQLSRYGTDRYTVYAVNTGLHFIWTGRASDMRLPQRRRI